MNKLKLVFGILFCIFVLPRAGAAGDFDGSKSLIFFITETVECGAEGDCQQGEAQSINLPQLLNVNFKEKKISGKLKSGELRTTKIRNIMRAEGNLILQGVERGKAWSILITQGGGNVTLTASGDQEGFIAFGACIPDPLKR